MVGLKNHCFNWYFRLISTAVGILTSKTREEISEKLGSVRMGTRNAANGAFVELKARLSMDVPRKLVALYHSPAKMKLAPTKDF